MKLRSLLALCPGASVTYLKKLGITLATASLIVGCSTSPTNQQTSEADLAPVTTAKRMTPTVVSRKEIRRVSPTAAQRATLAAGD